MYCNVLRNVNKINVDNAVSTENAATVICRASVHISVTEY